jgi:hypothetical protein
MPDAPLTPNETQWLAALASVIGLDSDLGAEPAGSRVGDRSELRISVAWSSPPGPLAH